MVSAEWDMLPAACAVYVQCSLPDQQSQAIRAARTLHHISVTGASRVKLLM